MRALQFRLRSLLILMGLVAILTGWYANRYRQMRNAAGVLEKHGASFSQGSIPHTWYDRLPFLNPPPRIVVLNINPSTDLEKIIPTIRDLGTVNRVSMYDMSAYDVELLSRVDSIRAVEAQWGLTADKLRPLLSLPLEEYSVTGSDVNIPADQLEMLLSIPTMKSIGMAHGESAVPKELLEKYPDVSYFMTDFPP